MWNRLVRGAGACLAGLQRPLLAAEYAAEALRRWLVPKAYRPQPRLAADYWIAAGVGLLGALIAARGFAAFHPRVFLFFNIYFQSDPSRVLAEITPGMAFDVIRRGGVHPIFAVLAGMPVKALMLAGISKLQAFATLLVANAAVCAGAFYLVVRGLGLSMAAAFVFSGAFLASATFIHWAPYVETYPFAMLSVIMVLLVMTSGSTNTLVWVLASAGSLSVTITNWAMGLAASAFNLTVRKLVLVTLAALALVSAIFLIQSAIFNDSNEDRYFFRLDVLRNETLFIRDDLLAGGARSLHAAANIGRVILLTSAVAPPPQLEPDPRGRVPCLVDYQNAALAWSRLGGAAMACWAFLLGAGLYGAWRIESHRPVALAIGLFSLFQICLHCLYGESTFLYAANYFPGLMTLAAFGWLTPLRGAVTAAAIAFIVLAGTNNATHFFATARLAKETALAMPYPVPACRPARS